MKIIETIREMQSWSLAEKLDGRRVAFVPTMGNLHDGHLALVDEAKNRADRVVVSIFVNPTQFGPNEDLDKYPRTFEQDRQKLESKGIDVLFFPAVDEVYPFGKDQATRISVPALGDILCGHQRPGHFDGVTMVVAKLFNIVQPDVAIFGEKDFQQLFLIRRMVEDLFMPIQVLSLPTIREPDGLAMSSRNGYLGLEERQIAPRLYEVLCRVREQLENRAMKASDVCQAAKAELNAVGFETEYLEVRTADGLQLIESIVDNDAVVFVAARLGVTRLIDNLPIILK